MFECRPWRWLWGLIPIALLCLFIFYIVRADIERDLKTRAQQALGEAELSWAVPSFQGRDAVINGTAGSEAERDKAHEIVRKIHGVRIVEDRAKLVPLVSPFTWAARHKEDKIRLKGYLPSEKDRSAILGIAKANFPDLSIDDEMKVARGVPSREAWLGGASYGLKVLSHLKRGIVQLSDTEVLIQGDPKDLQSYRELKDALDDGLPAGLKLKSVNISLPEVAPYIWSAKLEAGAITLDGFVPNPGFREEIKAIIENKRPNIALTDGTELAGKAPKDWGRVLAKVLGAFMRLNSGDLNFTDTTVLVSGTAADEETAREIMAVFKGDYPTAFKVKPGIDFVKPKEPEIPLISPYLFVAESGNGVLKLTGHVPSERVRASILAVVHAVLPDLRIVDEVKIARGGPGEAAWLDYIRYGLTQLKDLQFGRFALRESDMTLTGETGSSPALTSILTAMKAAPSGLTLDFKGVMPPRAMPYLWSSEFDGKKLVILGSVPDEASRRLILSLAKKSFSAPEIVDQMQIASGEPNGWSDAVRLALMQLARLKTGSVSLNDAALALQGVAPARQEADAITITLSESLPRGFTSKLALKVEEPPAPPAPVTPDEQAGQPQDAAAPQEGVDENQAQQPQEPVTQDEQETPGGAQEANAPQDAEEPLKGSDETQEHSAGQEPVNADQDQAAKDGGDTDTVQENREAEAADAPKENEASQESQDAQMAAPPAQSAKEAGQLAGATDQDSGQTGAEDSATLSDAKEPKQPQDSEDAGQNTAALEDKKPAEPVKADVCQELLNSELANGTIRFKTASAAINDGSKPLLDKLAATVKRCPNTHIEIAGHTDSDGSDSFNLKLSQQRAEAVADYLADAGVSRDLLIAVGYGEDKPVADNDTSENKAKNRRIEFRVRG